SLLGAIDSSATGGLSGTINEVFNTIKNVVNIVMPILLSVILVFGLIYSIILGVKYSKAEDTGARDEAKKALINCILGFVITLVLIAVIYIVLANIQTIYSTLVK
ncbi:MAG: hypothetical protein RR334_03380, partial [Clostridia bacterium]